MSISVDMIGKPEPDQGYDGSLKSLISSHLDPDGQYYYQTIVQQHYGTHIFLLIFQVVVMLDSRS